VLFHETTQSHGLLHQLLPDIERRYFVDYVPPDLSGAEVYSSMGLIMQMGPEGFRYLPNTGDVRSSTLFPFWWSGTIFKGANQPPVTREVIVNWLANKDGGAHVNPTLPMHYRSITREGGLGWRTNTIEGDQPLLDNPVLPAMRQIAEEILRSIPQLGLT
jgi:hypothetical protein